MATCSGAWYTITLTEKSSCEIDGREFSLREFGRMLVTHAGWGMRICFVPDDELEHDPEIEIREPDDEETD